LCKKRKKRTNGQIEVLRACREKLRKKKREEEGKRVVGRMDKIPHDSLVHGKI